MNEPLIEVKLKCIFSNGRLKLTEGREYIAQVSHWPYPDQFFMYVGDSDGKTCVAVDVWKAPSGLYYILKRHCQPWDGIFAMFEEVKS